MWRQLLGCALLWVSVSVSAESTMENAVSVSLEQLPDLQCNGLPDHETTVPPGACLIYRITAVNNGPESAHHVVIVADIPEHTRLHTPLSALDQSNDIAVAIQPLPVGQSAGNSLIKATVEQLPPGEAQQVVLTYAVQVL